MKSQSALATESGLMRFFRRIGLESVAWSLRRLHCPVGRRALVLEVGSGGNPYCRSNVLLDAYEETRERHWVPLVADRPIVLGFVERLPFRDKAFDFVIASHVLEHSADPARFLDELQRVARAGYIETPDAFMERVNPYRDHRLEITVRDGRLIIKKKVSWRVDAELEELYKYRAAATIAGQTIPLHPFGFHVRYYWQGRIDYEILNPDADAGWKASVTEKRLGQSVSLKQRLRDKTLRVLRVAFSQRRRNREIELLSLMICPECRSGRLAVVANQTVCRDCDTKYPMGNGIPIMHQAGHPAEAAR